MNKKNLLSIGELSQITGVHIKALRYYDSIGILTPASVDPDSGYRYYTFYQKAIVDAIQFCVELDIPLKYFNDFTNEAEPWICYKELVDKGTELVEEKMRVMQERLAHLKAMQSEIERSELSNRRAAPAKYFFPERICWIAPYEGAFACSDSNEIMKKLIKEIYRQGLKLGNVSGLLLLREEGEWKQYIFVDVTVPAIEAGFHLEILHITAGEYLCKKVEQSGIDQV